MNSELMSAAKAEIEENYATLYGVAELCDNLGVTKEHLVRSFKAQYGITPGAYLTAVKMARAKELVCGSDMPFKAIAINCGYSDEGYFGKVFKKEYGTSPGSMRKNNTDNEKIDYNDIAQSIYL